jgi:hypothetical protein
MPAINEEREADAKGSIPDRCQGKEVGGKKKWKLMRKELWRGRISESHNASTETTTYQSSTDFKSWKGFLIIIWLN